MSGWTDFDFGPTARVVFGPGRAKEVGRIACELEGAVALVMTDPVLYRLGMTEVVETSLADAGVRGEIFSDVATEPTLASVEAAVSMFRDRTCDIVVAVGGGSSMDSAKAVSLLVGNGGRFHEFTEQRVGTEWKKGRRADKRGPHVITMPTTAGTGAEVTAGCGVFNPETGIKGWASGPYVRPSVAVCDPLLTVSMPPRVTADTGFDALSQATEAVLTLKFNPYADALLYKAIETIGASLPKAFANGANLEARAAMLGAATMVGTAFPFGGLMHVHTYAEVLGDLTHLPHGRLIGLMLPYVLEWAAIGCPEKLALVGRALGERVDGCSVSEAAGRTLAAVRRLRDETEMNEPLRTLGVTEEMLRTCAERVYAQHTPRSVGGPRAFRNQDEVMSLLRAAY
ncbi:MAG: iron-containing alcohol dehydrogenase [Chloroflexi bacterium]|nr:iron-containing alcohol dehydrogenase [Chloroflexota bacterium]MBV9544537.1 iron-containing alcohol dehydrogenase [Chloroflexota bacterium]